MKHIRLVFLLFPIFCFSQCPPGGAFNSQAEIDALAIDYPDCTVLNGGLSISGDDITDLSGLNQIIFAPFLNINNNPILETLNGLNPNLDIFHGYQISFSISNNDSLTDISALSTASVSAGVDLYVTISDNPLLNSLNGLESIVYATFMSISNNDSLINLVGLGTSISELGISGNDNLIALNGLIDFDGDYLTINDNTSLVSFNIGNTIVGNLTISNNPNLTNIDFTGYSGVWETLTIENNNSLSICNVDFVCQFFGNTPPQFISINNNATGCNGKVEVENACGISPYNDDCVFDFFGYLDDYFIINIGETITTNNEFATTSAEIPSCNDIANRRDVWYTFNSGNLTSVDIIAEAGISLQLWEGDCNNLAQVTNACASGSLLDIPVQPDTYYILQVWSETNKRPVGWFDITVQDGLLSTPENIFNRITVYPNPIQNILNVKANTTISYISVYNILGQRVAEFQPNALETTIDLSHPRSGLFLVEITIGEQKSTYKIVKE